MIEDERIRTRMAVIYAIVAVLLLAACCTAGIWFSTALRDALTNLT